VIHWREIGTLDKIQAIRAVWVEGCSASQIAGTFRNVSRNAIIGMYNRYGQTHLSDMPLQAPPLSIASRKRKERTYTFKAAPVAKPPKAEIFEPTEYKLAGKPMMMLQAHECRFAVNDARADQTHLFCGRPTEKSYCAHHDALSRRAGQ
jgi:hypothetical protein